MRKGPKTTLRWNGPAMVLLSLSVSVAFAQPEDPRNHTNRAVKILNLVKPGSSINRFRLYALLQKHLPADRLISVSEFEALDLAWANAVKDRKDADVLVVRSDRPAVTTVLVKGVTWSLVRESPLVGSFARYSPLANPDQFHRVYSRPAEVYSIRDPSGKIGGWIQWFAGDGFELLNDQWFLEFPPDLKSSDHQVFLESWLSFFADRLKQAKQIQVNPAADALMRSPAWVFGQDVEGGRVLETECLTYGLTPVSEPFKQSIRPFLEHAQIVLQEPGRTPEKRQIVRWLGKLRGLVGDLVVETDVLPHLHKVFWLAMSDEDPAVFQSAARILAQYPELFRETDKRHLISIVQFASVIHLGRQRRFVFNEEGLPEDFPAEPMHIIRIHDIGALKFMTADLAAALEDVIEIIAGRSLLEEEATALLKSPTAAQRLQGIAVARALKWPLSLPLERLVVSIALDPKTDLPGRKWQTPLHHSWIGEFDLGKVAVKLVFERFHSLSVGEQLRAKLAWYSDPEFRRHAKEYAPRLCERVMR